MLAGLQGSTLMIYYFLFVWLGKLLRDLAQSHSLVVSKEQQRLKLIVMIHLICLYLKVAAN